MKTQFNRLLSLLLAVLLVLSLPMSAMAATTEDGGLATEPETTEPATTIPDETEPGTTVPESTEPESTIADTSEPVEAPEQPTLIISSEAIKEDNPFDPEWPHPYGLPVDNAFPEDLLEVDPYGIALLADMSLIPDEMYDNSILRALAYTGYDVDYLRDNGYLYVAQYTSSNLKNTAPQVLSGIGYDDYSPYVNGDETVTDATTVSGKAPNMAKFREQGFVCASFVTYYLCNFLPNIEGIDTDWIHDAVAATTMNNGSYSTASVWAWETGLKNLSNQAGSGVTRYTDADEAYENLVPGDVIVFSNSSGNLTHVAIYAGAYTMYNASGTNRGIYHYIIHVGNSRGPEISAVEYMVSSGSKSSSPSAFYHIDLGDSVDATGYIEVNKSDPNGIALAGAYFAAVNSATNEKYVIGPTNASGYAKSGELPLGTYTVTETVFPSGYEASGQASWTVTLSKDTPNMTITIDAVNQLITGGLKIQKATNTGKSLSGWVFGVYTDKGCTKPIPGSPFTTPSSGVISVTGLAPGTYYVKELTASNAFWVTDNGVKTVTVTGNNTATVTVSNTHYGYAEIIKQTNTGKNLSGWKFNIYTDKACTKIVSGSPFITDTSGKISVKLLPGTYYVREVDESAQYPGWVFDTTVRSVTVTAGQTGSVTFTNSMKTYVKLVKRTNTGGSLAGWKFNIFYDADCTKLMDGSPFITGEDGTILVQIEPGNYFIEEVNEADKYPDWDFDRGTHIVTINPGETASVYFENTHYGYAKIIKQTNTGSNLSGWKFNIFSDQSCTTLVEGSPFITGEDGTITARLLPGDYYVQEIDESDKYPDWTFDTTIRKVTVKAGETGSVTVTNTQSGQAKLIKAMPDGGSAAGWTFEVYRASDNSLVGTCTTGEDGTILTDNLMPGEYLVKEILPEDSLYWCETANPQTVTIQGGKVAEVTFTNRLKPGEISIQKVNEKGEPLAGAEFLLEWSVDGTTWQAVTYTDGAYVTEGTCTTPGLVDGKLRSSDEGEVTFSGLHPERLYRLTETAAPDGYQLLAGPAYEGGLSMESELLVTLTVLNFPVFELPKTGSSALLTMRILGILCTGTSLLLFAVTYRKKKV